MDYGQPIYSTGMNAQSTPQAPIASENGDIVLSPTRKKGGKRWPFVLGAMSFLIAAVAIVALVFISKDSPVESVSTDQGVYILMKDSYGDITNIQQTFIDLRDGYYSAAGLFTDNTHSYINEMGETIANFHRNVSQIDSSKITVQLAKENIEKLKAYLDLITPAYTETVSLYNRYYESGDYNSETVVHDIFSAYTNTEDFTSVYFYEIMGDLLAELQDYEEVE